MSRFGIYVFLLQLVHALSKDVVSYKGYRVYRVYEKGLRIPKLRIPHSKERLSVLTEHLEFDGDNNPLTVRSYLIPHATDPLFRRLLDDAGARYNVSVDDLDKDIQEEQKEGPSRRTGPGDWQVTSKYFSHYEMCEFIKDMEKFKNPVNSMPIAVAEPIGTSLEGRDIYMVKISSNHMAQKPIIFIEAGIHAREWTAPSTALYIIHQLVVNHTHNARVLDHIDFYVIPLSNPDGYEYSRATDRLWRKTRSFYKGHYGVDGNRNFGFHWGEAGASSNPASEVFKGPFPFSEVETRNIRDAGMRYKDRINVFVSIHAYGPCILYPWSYKITAPAPQADVMERIARAAVHAISAYSGTEYNHGSSSTMMYEASGGSDDYFKGVLGVDLSFTFEVSSGDKRSFIVPTAKIQEIASEAYVGCKVIAEHAAHYRKKPSRRAAASLLVSVDVD